MLTGSNALNIGPHEFVVSNRDRVSELSERHSRGKTTISRKLAIVIQL
jgi:hypothetical protein